MIVILKKRQALYGVLAENSNSYSFQRVSRQMYLLFSPKVSGRKTRHREPKEVIEEILHLVKEYGIEAIWFTDDTPTVNKKWLGELCSLLIEDGTPIKWACQARANSIDENLLKKMKKAGCIQMEFGVESGSQKVLNALKKGVTVNQTIEAFKLCKKLKIRTMANIMIANPQ